MSQTFHFYTEKKVNPTELFHWLSRRRHGLLEIIDKAPTYYFYVPLQSLRGVDFSEEDYGYEIRVTSLSTEADFVLANDISLYVEMNTGGVFPKNEYGEQLRSTILFNNKAMIRQRKSDVGMMATLVKNGQSVSIFCPKREIHVTLQMIEDAEALKKEKKIPVHETLLAALLKEAWMGENYIPASSDLAPRPPAQRIKSGRTWKPDEWYDLLVQQSRTNYIYGLIHENIYHLWDPGHKMDFVTIRLATLPEKLKPIPPAHISKSLNRDQYSFPGDDYVLLSNRYLTEYLEAAKWIEMIEDFDGCGFLELHFSNKEDVASEKGIGEEQELSKEEQLMLEAYNELVKDGDKTRSLKNIECVENWLAGLFPSEKEQRMKWLYAWNIIAMVYAWCGKLDKAAEADKRYIFLPEVWKPLEDSIKAYLEMLMIRKETDYLDWLFSNKDFSKFFVLHHEVYVSLFQNPHYELTVNMGLFVNAVNRINNSGKYRS